MSTQQNETRTQHPGITGETVLAIISVALSALWIAFAYYKGVGPHADGSRIMLLHPLVALALIGLLIRIYKWIGIKFVVQLEIIMISLWLFVRMLGVLMPFIMGFGFAYLFRFLWQALPFKKYYQRAIVTVLVILISSAALVLTGLSVRKQIVDMTKELQIFYHETLLPLVIGEEFIALEIEADGETETRYLATNHGIYILQEKEDKKDKEERTNGELVDKKWSIVKKGIINGELVGKKVLSIAVNNDFIYAGTTNGLYRCPKGIVQDKKDEKDEKDKKLIWQKIKNVFGFFKGDADKNQQNEKLIWQKLTNVPFKNSPIQTVETPVWNQKLIYVGTDRALYESSNSGISWGKIDIDKAGNRSINSIVSIERFENNRKKLNVYVASTLSKTDEKTKENIHTTEVHQYQVDTPDEWNNLEYINLNGESAPRIHALAPTRREDVEIYAGTEKGMWEKEKHASGDWRKEIENSKRLPQAIILLNLGPSGLYAGSDEIIRHQPRDNTNTWNVFLNKAQGILRFRNEPFIKQFESYLTEKIPGLTAEGGTFLKWLSGLAGSIAFQFGGFIATVFLAFIVFVYANQGLDKYFLGIINLIPEKHRQTTKAYLTEIDRNMHQFLRGQFTVILIVSIISCIIYRLVGVPFALLIGILAGLCNAIPTFGPFIGGGFALIAMLIGFAAGDFGNTFDFLIRCVFVLGAILGIQTIDNSLISPKVMSNAVDVDPLLIMFSVIVGASILGFWGVLLAIPIIVVIKSVISVSQTTASGTDPPQVQEHP